MNNSKWIIDDDELTATVISEPGGKYTVLSVDKEGTIRFGGDNWKTCPRLFGRNCHRPGSVRPPDRCDYCLWSGMAPIGDRKMAIGVASEIIKMTNEDSDIIPA